MFTKACVLLYVACAAVGCDGRDPIVCEPNSTPAIAMSVIDSARGIRTLRPALVIATDGSYRDSVVATATGEVALASGRPGQYTVSVTAPDYMKWTRSVSVVQLGCSLQTVHLTARLQQDTSSTFSAYYSGRGEFSDPTLVRVRFMVGAFTLDIAAPHLWPTEFTIPTSGTARIRFSLVASPQDTLATAETTLDLAPASIFGVSGIVAATRPVGVCVGKITSVPLQARTGAVVSDSLFVSVGGLPRGTIC